MRHKDTENKHPLTTLETDTGTTPEADTGETVVQARTLSGWPKYLFSAVAIAGSLFHLYILNFQPMEPWTFRTAHVVLGLFLGFMLYPGWRTTTSRINLVDWSLITLSVLIGWYIWANLDQLYFRFGLNPNGLDFLVALTGILLILELTRRTSGWALPSLAGIFLFYIFAGPYLPGILQHSGYTVDRAATYMFSTQGIFGVTTDVSARYIILFLIFGAFLQKSGVGQYFIDVAYAISGRQRGGPAKVAVVGSALLGTVSGSAAGNVVTSGPLTIPLMKATGFKPRFAAAVEATASAGGQILPPVMGAGIFLMVEFTGIPYVEIISAALIPALLYFVSVYLMIDAESIKKGLGGMAQDQIPRLREMIKRVHLFLPLVILVWMLVSGYSIMRSGSIAIAACFLVGLFSKDTRMGLKHVLQALELGMRNAIQLVAIVACAGIIVGTIGLTGIGQRFSSMLLSIAGGSIFLALVFAMILCVILGLGMPTTAAYAVAASIVAPALINVGLEPLTAHLFVFYYAVLGAITPPVAVASFAAAGIAGTNPMKTALTAFKLGLAAFIVPFMFYYTPELLLTEGTPWEIVVGVASSLLGIYLLAAGVQGWFIGVEPKNITRLLLVAAAILFMLASGWSVAAGTIALAIAVTINIVALRSRKKESTSAN